MVNLTPEQREVGQHNYYSAVTEYERRMSRRDFMWRSIIAGGATAAGVGAMYFGYNQPSDPVNVAVIGTGDEGSVLMGAINPDYVTVKAICDIRPSSIHRAFHGDWSSNNAKKVRPGLMDVYGWNTEDEARRNVKVYTDWQECVRDPDIQGVIIATPLFLHAPMAVAAMNAGKHVLCEKLMAHNVPQCKLMCRAAAENGAFLSVGHQRHYSILYDNAVNLIEWGLLGELHHIRAQWHRGNLPGSDSWCVPMPGGELSRRLDRNGNPIRVDKIMSDVRSFERQIADLNEDSSSDRRDILKLRAKMAQWLAMDADREVDAARYGYIDDHEVYGEGRTRTALEELIRWRLWDRTGGGLMAELGSHQLDAASIFISALGKKTGKHVHPLTVHAVGGRHTFPQDRDAEDHVYCMFEFPGQGYDYDFDVGYDDVVNNYPDTERGIPSYDEVNDKKIVVSYSSINGNGYGGYGEIVMGSKGTLILDREKEALLYKKSDTYAKAGVKPKGGSAVLDTSASGDAAPAQAAQSGPVSRGYREEIEHWAWCIASGSPDNQPRCNGPIALADATIALTAKQAIKNSQRRGGHGFIQFEHGWFDPDSNECPEATSIEEANRLFQQEMQNLKMS